MNLVIKKKKKTAFLYKYEIVWFTVIVYGCENIAGFTVITNSQCNSTKLSQIIYV